MNTSNKRALFTCIIYGALFLFLLLYFIIAGPNAYLNNKIHFVINSIVFVIALFSFGTMLIFTQKKGIIIDERDNYVLEERNHLRGIRKNFPIRTLNLFLG